MHESYASGTEKHLLHARRLIERWQGGRAKIWEFSSSLRGLTVRIEMDGKRGNLHVRCVDTEFIHSPTSWYNCRLSILVAEGADGYPESMTLRDEGADVSIVAGDIRAA